jgi:hypothetical protein
VWRRDERSLLAALERLRRASSAIGAPACALREWAPAYLASVHTLYVGASTAVRPTGDFVTDAGRACTRFSEDVGALQIPTSVPDAQVLASRYEQALRLLGRDLAALRPPDGRAPEVRALVARIEKARRAFSDAFDAVSNGDRQGLTQIADQLGRAGPDIEHRFAALGVRC